MNSKARLWIMCLKKFSEAATEGGITLDELHSDMKSFNLVVTITRKYIWCILKTVWMFLGGAETSVMPLS